MAIHDLKEQMARLPHQPGVYLFSNAAGETLYVGKARSLRDRVRSYLGAYGISPRHDALLDEATRLEVVVTDSVVEALALENNLIKQRFPRYNILLRDDKNYPYLQLTTTEAFPRVLVARHVETGGDFFAGPFLPAKLARRTMALTHKMFGIRSCNEVITGTARRARASNTTSAAAWRRAWRRSARRSATRAAVADTRLFLEGRTEELGVQLRERMTGAAADERFEEAAQLRDAIRTIDAVRERQQKMATAGLNDRDVIGVKLGTEGAVVQVFVFRGGRVIERFELQTVRPVGARPGAAARRGGRRSVDAAGVRRRIRSRAARGGAAAALRRHSAAAGDPRGGRAARQGRARGVARRRAPSARCASSCRSAATRRTWWSWRSATRRSPIARASIRRPRRTTTRSTAEGDPEAAGAAAPHRVLRHLDDPGQRDRGVAGRVRRRPDEARRVSQVPRARRERSGAADLLPPSDADRPSSVRRARRPPRFSTTSPR